MKIIIILLMTFYSIGIQAQSYYKTFGSEAEYHSILLIQVFDSETRQPINGATITIKSDMFEYPQKFLTSHGTVVLIFKSFTKAYKDFSGEITHPNYAFREFAISQYDYRDKVIGTKIHISKYERSSATSSEIAEEIRMGRFNTHGIPREDYYLQLVGCYELKLEMNRIDRGIYRDNVRTESSRNQEYKRSTNSLNEDSRNQYPTEILIKCEECNGTGKCKDCNGKGKIGYSICRYCGATGFCPYCGGRGKIVKHIR